MKVRSKAAYGPSSGLHNQIFGRVLGVGVCVLGENLKNARSLTLLGRREGARKADRQ